MSNPASKTTTVKITQKENGSYTAQIVQNNGVPTHVADAAAAAASAAASGATSAVSTSNGQPLPLTSKGISTSVMSSAQGQSGPQGGRRRSRRRGCTRRKGGKRKQSRNRNRR